MLHNHRVKFSPDYVRLVLNENFEDAKAQFLAPLMAIEYAHLVMLADQEIVVARRSRGDPPRARRHPIGRDVARVSYDGTYEDLFFYLERLVVAGCGEDAAGRLHTARSRNDIDMTMYRMSQRQLILAVLDGTLALRARADSARRAAIARRYSPRTRTRSPPSPPPSRTTCRRSIEQLERDAVRLRPAYASTNQNPLGACAITGTGFPIDRDRTTELLGFDGDDLQHLRQHRDGRLPARERRARTAVLLVGLGRVVQDLLLWCTMEFGYLRLADGFVQGSSIMPQKRNPVALEHARAIAQQGRSARRRR